MNEKYKIGTISKILGIPSQTLHYYEKCGFVTPEKDAQSGYRYYDAWDINFLLDSKYWQSYEFSTNNVEQMINTDTISDVQNRLSLQKEYLTTKLVHYQNLICQIEEEKQRISMISEHKNHYEIMNSPILYYDTYRKNNIYQSSESPENLPQMTNWIKAFPFVQATFIVDKESILSENNFPLSYWWGFSVTPSKARAMNFGFCNQASFLPSMKCIYTIFEASTRDTFSTALLEQVFKPVQAQKYQIIANPVGRLIVRTHAPGKYTRYFEIWIPVL